MISVPGQRSAAGGIELGAAKVLFEGQYCSVQAGRTYDISPDGSRFLMIKSAATPSASSAPQLEP